MKQEIVSCDMCGKRRKSLGEQWYVVKLVLEPGGQATVGFHCYPLPCGVEGKDACGEVCAMRFFDCWLSHGNLEEGEPRPVTARSA